MIIYVVKKGDTLYSIGNKYNKNPSLLAKENGINISQSLVIGQTIVIPQNKEKLGDIATNGYLYTNIKEDILRESLPYLTFATIFTYGFKKDGSLIPADDEKVLNIIKQYDTKPIMLISPLAEDGSFNNSLASEILNNINSQNALINNIIKALKEKEYFGLDIDFEFVLPKDEKPFIAFIENVTKKLNKEGYPVTVSLAPKTSSSQKGILYEAHNYEKIGAISNAVLLMTYEWGYTYGEPMPVAPINKVKKVLDYGTSVIPSNKIFMGIPNYGYDWPLPFIKGSTKAMSIGNEEAINIARENNAKILFDDVAKSPYFNYYNKKDNKEHIVYFEDGRSIYEKLNTAFSYNLLGVSYWNLMRSFSQNWLILSQLFNIYKIK